MYPFALTLGAFSIIFYKHKVEASFDYKPEIVLGSST